MKAFVKVLVVVELSDVDNEEEANELVEGLPRWTSIKRGGLRFDRIAEVLASNDFEVRLVDDDATVMQVFG